MTCALHPSQCYLFIYKKVMFGRQNEGFNKKRYDLSISSCALEHDLQMLGDGDQTEIGEKGITLSGGQKARIGMARAVYHDADIYLLDDPLAAVDAHVGKHLFQECIVNELLLNKSGSSSESQKKSSIILVTNAIQYLSDPNVDKIVVLDNGSIAEVGNYKELSENPDSLFSSFLSVVLDTGAHSHASENEDEEEEESSTDSDKESFDDKSLGSNVWEGFLSKFSPKKPIEPMPDKSKKNHVIDGESYQNIVSKVPTSPKKRRISKKASFKEKKSDKLSSSVKSVDKAPPPTTPLMTSELGEREKGQVTSEVYLTWAKAAGGTLVGIVVILAYIVDQGIGVASKWWLTYWSRNGGGSPSAAREFLLVYAIINLTSIVSMFGRVVFLMFSGLRASRKLFTELLEVVLQAPMSFFDSEYKIVLLCLYTYV
jgi:ABC-type glutathione transport system ATPase component